MSSSKIWVPDRHFQQDVRAAGAGALPAHALLAVHGLEMLLVAIVDQRVQPVDAFREDIAAAPAVSAIRAAELDEFFATEGEPAVPAIAGAEEAKLKSPDRPTENKGRRSR